MRRYFFSYILLIIYIAFAAFSLVLAIKPGASIFYYKVRLDPILIKQDAGFSYRYPIKGNIYFFPPKKIIFKENDLFLKEDTSAAVTEEGKGLFWITIPSENVYYLYFAANDNSDPRTNGYSYTVFLPVIFFSRSMGLVYLALLSLIAFRFFIIIVRSPAQRTFIRSHKHGFIHTLDTYFIQEFKRIFFPVTNFQVLTSYRSAVWKSVLAWIILSDFAYVAFEWLFYVTKPSFFDLIPLAEKIEILFQTGFLLILPTILLSLFLWILDSLLVLINKNGIPLYLSTLLPSVILACLSLLIIDNFTYTLFSFGVVTTEGPLRGLYTSMFIIWLAYLHRYILKKLGLRGNEQPLLTPTGNRYYPIQGLFLISSILFLARFDFSAVTGMISSGSEMKSTAKPNILLLGADGLNAGHLSAYGYERTTTPTMEELVADSLLVENAYTNSAHSTGSIISMLNSKLPVQTRVLNSPDILKGKDSFQHLPGILKREGYFTAEIGLVHYIDAYNLNMRNGFDMVNDRSLGENIYFKNTHGSSLDETFYFTYLLSNRISERLQHIFFIQKMENPILQVTDFDDYHRDDQRVEKLLEIITSTEEPFFVHAHMMVTHGAKFTPHIEEYSLGKTQTEDWMNDFYDDAILSFDDNLRIILDTLESSGKMDKTVLIIYSDHGQEYKINVRIPLMFHFPGAEYAGRVRANAQNLDIAPTLLDYLGLAIPEWMEGNSLLRDNLPSNRLIYSYQMKQDRSEGELLKPPFYQFGYFNLIQCDKWYLYVVELEKWESGDIVGHTAPCITEEPVFSLDEIQQELIEHLNTNLFDITGLP